MAKRARKQRDHELELDAEDLDAVGPEDFDAEADALHLAYEPDADGEGDALEPSDDEETDDAEGDDDVDRDRWASRRAARWFAEELDDDGDE